MDPKVVVPKKDKDATKYIVSVLWVAGFTQSSICKSLSLRKSQLEYIIKGLDFGRRFDMTDADRQAELEKLRIARLAFARNNDGTTPDKGVLDKFNWSIRKLTRKGGPRQVKAAVEPGYGGRGRVLRVVTRKNDVVVDIMASPIEYLNERGWLVSKQDRDDVAGVRFSTALRLREYMEGAGLGNVKSGWAGEKVGSGGNSPGQPITDYRVDCLKMLGRMRKAMPKAYMSMLEQMLMADRFVWDESRRQRRAVMILKIHHALDLAAVEFGYMNVDSVVTRWGKAYGTLPSAKRRLRHSHPA
jgi:hypothetical protein